MKIFNLITIMIVLAVTALIAVPVSVNAQVQVGPAFIAYEQATVEVCNRGRFDLAAAERASAHLTAAVETAKYGRGRQSNFWGPIGLQEKTERCTQAPGAGGNGAAAE